MTAPLTPAQRAPLARQLAEACDLPVPRKSLEELYYDQSKLCDLLADALGRAKQLHLELAEHRLAEWERNREVVG